MRASYAPCLSQRNSPLRIAFGSLLLSCNRQLYIHTLRDYLRSVGGNCVGFLLLRVRRIEDVVDAFGFWREMGWCATLQGGELSYGIALNECIPEFD